MSKISSRAPTVPPSTATITTPPAISPTPIPPQPPTPPSPPSGGTTTKKRGGQTLKIDRPVETFNRRGEVGAPGRRGAHIDMRLIPLYDIDSGDVEDFEEGEEGDEPFTHRRRRRRRIEPPFYILHRLVANGAIGSDKTPT